MMADQLHVHSGRAQGQRDQEPQLAVAQDDHRLSGRFVQHVQGSRQRLGKHRVLVRHRVGHRHQTALRHAELLREGPVATDDAEDGSTLAVVPEGHSAIVAASTACIDVGDHAAPQPARVLCLDDLGHHLVSQHTGESHVATCELEIRVAHAGHAQREASLSGRAPGPRTIADQPRWVAVDECQHRCGAYTRAWAAARAGLLCFGLEARTTAVPTIVFLEGVSGRDKTVDVPDGGELLDICDEHYASVPFSCRSATCATC